MEGQGLAYVLTWTSRRSVHSICNLIFFQKYYIISYKEKERGITMYIDPALFTLGVMSVTNAIKENTRNDSHTYHTSCKTTPKIDEKKLAEELVEAQERKKLRDEKFKREYEKSLDCYCIQYGRDVYGTPKEMKYLQSVLQKNKPVCFSHTNSAYKVRIYPPDNEMSEYYVEIGTDKVSAYILQFYMSYFGSHPSDYHRENINGEIYFIIKIDFLKQMGWFEK